MKESTSQRLKEIMDMRGIKQIDIVKMAEPFCIQYDVKLGRNDLSQYVSGKAKPTQKKLLILSKALGVSVAWLMGLDVSVDSHDSSITCPMCDCMYRPDNTEELNHHAKRHTQYLNAMKKYGFWLTYQQRENLKHKSQEILNNKNAPESKKIDAAENICKAYFSRSLGAVDFDLRHPDFEEYTSMLLSQQTFKEEFKPVYDTLVKKYGVRNGLPNGHTYYNCLTNENKEENDSNTQKIFAFSPEEKRLLEKYKSLNKKGRIKVNEYIEDLACNPTYTVNEITVDEIQRAIDERNKAAQNELQIAAHGGDGVRVVNVENVRHELIDKLIKENQRRHEK